MEFLRTLRDALKLLVLVRPSRPPRRIGPEQFWLALLLFGAMLAVDSWLATPAPRAFDFSGLHGLAFAGVVLLLVSYLAALLLRRPALFWPLAALLLVTQTLIDALQRVIEYSPFGLVPGSPESRAVASVVFWLVSTVLVTRRIFDYLEPYRSWLVRGGAALAVSVAVLLPLWFIGTGSLFHPDFDEDDFSGYEASAPGFEPEEVMAVQATLLDEALQQLAPQRPGTVDLYVVAFGGDGSEDVFRNEVEYAERLFAQRFDARGRTLVLLNHPDTVAQRPLATLTNLRHALRRVGEIADREEDLVLLFLTTHGSEDHELYVALDPLPLNQIEPEELAGAITEARIGWRVVVVSACYSGGFLPALRNDHALVMTAARADRTSFGCGADSDITYFGRAYFAEALNQTRSLREAFDIAKQAIAAREKAEDQRRSYPQMAGSAAIEAKLAQWQATLAPAEPLPFETPDKGGATGAAASE